MFKIMSTILSATILIKQITLLTTLYLILHFINLYSNLRGKFNNFFQENNLVSLLVEDFHRF